MQNRAKMLNSRLPRCYSSANYTTATIIQTNNKTIGHYLALAV